MTSTPEPTSAPGGSAPGSSAPGSSAPGRSSLDARLEAEISEALAGMSVDQLMDLPDAGRPKPLPRGTIHREFRRGIVVGVRGDAVLVEFGPKSSGICPLSQFEEPPPIGTHLEFVVERHDPKEGVLILSREGAVHKASWEALGVGQVVEAVCTGMNKGGLEFEVAQHKAFMPAGQVDIRHVKDISVFLGQKLPCEIVQLDRQRGRVVLSRKAVLEKERQRNAEKVLAELEPGQERDATITSVQPFGAFADLGGIDGLIHVSDLSWDRVGHARDVVQEGQQVRVRVLKVDRTQSPPKIALGLKQTVADPTESRYGEIAEGATVSGRVTKLMAFGAFVEIAPGVEGLVHISEIAYERIPTVESVLKKDQVVSAKVLKIDPAQRRVALSMKALADRPAPVEKRGRHGRGGEGRSEEAMREDDPAMRKLRAKFGAGGGLKGGIA